MVKMIINSESKVLIVYFSNIIITEMLISIFFKHLQRKLSYKYLYIPEKFVREISINEIHSEFPILHVPVYSH